MKSVRSARGVSSQSKARTLAGKQHVFLGGTCGDTTWRRPFIALLEKTETSYFNPQLPKGVEWKAEHAEKEKRELPKASIVVMVITNDTTGIVSLLELSELFAKFNLKPNSRNILLAFVEGPDRAGARETAGKDRLRAIEFLKQRMSPPCTLLLTSQKEVLDSLGHELRRRA